MNIYLVRHGETDENIRGTYYGDKDARLTERGIKQAGNIKKHLEGISFDKVFCSEKIRAVETLNCIYSGSYTKDRRLNERSFGIFEGMTYMEIDKKYHKECMEWNADWKRYRMEGGESFFEFYNRVCTFMDSLKKCDYNNVLVCTHGGVIKSIFSYVLGGDLDLYWKFASKNGDVSVIKYEYGNFFIDSIVHIEG